MSDPFSWLRGLDATTGDELALTELWPIALDVIEASRRAERKLWHEYRRLDVNRSAEPDESWAEGERLADALAAFLAAAEKERA